jgi:sulfate adenylyltransferase subunit 1
VDLALLTDGLRAEREQGITIDVAYRYFATPKRKFIIADTPGHIQYTRNMVTGASTANVALILVDARHGVIEQTLRHAFIASLLQIPHIIICINKMDLVGFSEKVFDGIRNQFMGYRSKLNTRDVRFVPISAKYGDSVVERSANMPWYQGPTLMYLLEHIHIANDYNFNDFRFPVQTVIRPNSEEFHDYRSYAGRIASGIINRGDRVKVLPSGLISTVESIDVFNGSVEAAFAPQSVSIRLADDIDISRGDMLVHEKNGPDVDQDVDLMICWMNQKPLVPGGKYLLRHTTRELKCVIKGVAYKMDINTLEKNADEKNIGLNDIGRISIRVTKPLFFDPYNENRNTGSLILIDEASNETVGAGMIV